MIANLLVGKIIEAMEIHKHPPSQPIKGIVQSTHGNGTAHIVDQHNTIIHVRLNGAKVVPR